MNPSPMNPNCVVCTAWGEPCKYHRLNWSSAGSVSEQARNFTTVEPETGGFVTKDSGERLVNPSGMVRDVATDKIDYSLVFDGPMFKRWAELLDRGARKYDKRNWMKANSQEEYDRARESLVRHLIQYLDGETDEDHAAAVFFNINEMEYIKEKLG